MSLPLPPRRSYESRRGGAAVSPVTDARHTARRGLRQRDITRHDLDEGRALYPDEHAPRPVTRGDCENGVRPCPYAGCRYSLRLHVIPATGTLQFPQDEESEGPSCALDVAEEGPLGQDDVGALLGVSGELVRRITRVALAKVHLALFPGETP